MQLRFGPSAVLSLKFRTGISRRCSDEHPVSRNAEVVKLVDTLASGASARKGVEVQVLSSAP